jgi:hypothetical protein
MDIHNPSNIILFRHVICLIIHTAILADQSSKPLKDKVETLIATLNNRSNEASKSDRLQDNCTAITNNNSNNSNNNKIPQVP